ncbi:MULTISPECIES: hypothetical protein [Paenisporosarcina]|uniref:Uncharacterized protein n=1 Tax=Paenisporosarcina antarctica TaxID=417367 RepID=A0A4P6ZW05_9BACL|nr:MULTISPECIES: hypothetical protein [Paenisporosarcina]QBP40219.1 hypothetical protein E2636_03215 [Paenisporosarcina antarctica]
MLLFKYFKDDSGEYLGIRGEYEYFVFIPVTTNKKEIVTLFDYAEEKIEAHYLENEEEIHQMKIYMMEDPRIVKRIHAIKNYQKYYSISHDEFLESFPG